MLPPAFGVDRQKTELAPSFGKEENPSDLPVRFSADGPAFLNKGENGFLMFSQCFLGFQPGEVVFYLTDQLHPLFDISWICKSNGHIHHLLLQIGQNQSRAGDDQHDDHQLADDFFIEKFSAQHPASQPDQHKGEEDDRLPEHVKG